jgi:hypothetical protein
MFKEKSKFAFVSNPLKNLSMTRMNSEDENHAKK